MSEKVVEKPSIQNGPNPLIIGVPLAIATIFCFGFVAMHPYNGGSPVSRSKDKPSTSNTPASLPPIGISAASVQKLSPINETAATESQPASPSAGVAPTSQNPQESKDSSVAAGRDEIQSATQTKDLYNIKISVPKTPQAQSRR